MIKNIVTPLDTQIYTGDLNSKEKMQPHTGQYTLLLNTQVDRFSYSPTDTIHSSSQSTNISTNPYIIASSCYYQSHTNYCPSTTTTFTQSILSTITRNLHNMASSSYAHPSLLSFQKYFNIFFMLS